MSHAINYDEQISELGSDTSHSDWIKFGQQQQTAGSEVSNWLENWRYLSVWAPKPFISINWWAKCHAISTTSID